MPKIVERLRHAWNAFTNNRESNYIPGSSYSRRPDRPRLTRGNERTIVTAIYTRIAIDVSSVKIFHARVDENGMYKSTIKSGLNNCLTLDANMDQTGRDFIRDAVISMLDEGCVALVPVETTLNPYTSSFDITNIRTGLITQWYPDKVKVQVYNEKEGRKEELILPKKMVAIIENPLYSIMNEPNSTLQRLVRKLSLLDEVDEQSSAGKLDIIVQLPYLIKSKARKEQAESRRKEIESQLAGSKYGIAYTDGTEKITQLNRPIENNLMKQIEYLTTMLYGQLGITDEVINGTANEAVMLNYYNRTIEPILAAFADEMTRKFLTKTARSQNQDIVYIRDPFRLVPVQNIADIADKFTRNEILTSNEIRGIVGFKPSDEPNASELRNKSLYPTETPEQTEGALPGAENQNGSNVDPEIAAAEQRLAEIENMSDDELANVSPEEVQELGRKLGLM